MKVELILPRRDESKLAHLGVYLVPLTLIQLAAAIPEEVEVRLTDENLTNLDVSWKPDLAAISVMTSQVRRAEEISKLYKKSGSKVLWGGIHPTVVDQSDNRYIDSFVVGEGEEILPKIITDLKEGDLKRRYVQESQTNLSMLPLPRRDLLRPSIDLVVETVMTKRGCPRKCFYCSSDIVYGKKIRYKNIPLLEKDFESIQSQNIFIVDDNFFVNQKYAKSVLDAVGSFGKNILLQVDPKTASDESKIEYLAKAGTRFVLIGFESVNPKNFDANDKYVPPSEWARIVENFHKYNIFVDGGFIIGFDNDDESVFEKTRKAVEKSGMDSSAFSVLTPYPGTQLHTNLNGRIFDRDWDHYDLKHSVFSPLNMTPQRLEEGVRELKSLYPNLYLAVKERLS